MTKRAVPTKSKTKVKQRPERKGRLSAWFQHHQQVAVESLERLLKETGSSVMTWFVIGIALALPICLLLTTQNFQEFGSDIEDAAQISIFMEIGANDDYLDDLSADIKLRKNVADVQVITATQALKDFQSVSEFGNVLAGLDENPLPASLVVKPNTVDALQVEALFVELEQLDGVDSAQLDMEWVQRLDSILNLAERMIVVLSALLCVGVVLVVGNTVRLAIENRRAEIVVVKLVGGTDAYVARPFLYTGLWYGVGGGIIACLLVLIAQFALQGPVSRMTGLYESGYSLLGLNISEVLFILMGSGVLGWIGAWLSVLRHLRDIEPK